jgi:hypothetical protein
MHDCTWFRQHSIAEAMESVWRQAAGLSNTLAANNLQDSPGEMAERLKAPVC